MAEKADRGLAGATEGTVSSFHQRKKQKSSPGSALPSSRAPEDRWLFIKPGSGGGGRGVVYPQQHHVVWAHKGAGLRFAQAEGGAQRQLWAREALCRSHPVPPTQPDSLRAR